MNKFVAHPSSQQRHISNAQNAELAMCEKCKELDAKIEHYRWLSASISDKQTLDGIKALIAGYEAQKKALHPEE
jgi:hypothetical protein